MVGENLTYYTIKYNFTKQFAPFSEMAAPIQIMLNLLACSGHLHVQEVGENFVAHQE